MGELTATKPPVCSAVWPRLDLMWKRWKVNGSDYKRKWTNWKCNEPLLLMLLLLLLLLLLVLLLVLLLSR
jgi:hypothetical protein